MEVSYFTNREFLCQGFSRAIEGEQSVLLRAMYQKDDPGDFARSVAAGLNESPRRLECRFLYDARGSELYEQICSQPEYYPTRTETAILARHAVEIRDTTGPVTILELGSGSSVKTDHLLKAYLNCGPGLCYIPIDVSESALRQASRAITQRYPGVRVIGINGTYQDAFPLFSAATPTLLTFLGSSIGNFSASECSDFLQEIANHLDSGDFFLLGVDLIKDPALLEAAYDDAAGVTAAFTLNLFARMNRELGTHLTLDDIRHVARYRPDREQVEIHARFLRSQTVDIAPLRQSFRIAEGEEILVEISRKFRLETMIPQLESYGLQLRKTFTDERNWFGLLLLQKTREIVAKRH